MPYSPHFRLHSCWSKAGLGTSIILEFSPHQDQHPSGRSQSGSSSINNKPGPRIALDLGATPCYGESVKAGTVLLTHSHVDHVGAIFAHARAYSLTHGGAAPTYYAPIEVVPLLENALQAMSALDGAVLENVDEDIPERQYKPLQVNFVGVAPGDEVMLSHVKHTHNVRVFVRVVRVFHARCPAVGYVIGTRHAPGLKPEYKGKPKEEIREAVAQGINVKSDPVDVLEVAYTGDTSIDTFQRGRTHDEISDDRSSIENKNALYLQQLLQCPLLFCETTFLMKDEEEFARSRGHMHLQDVLTEVILKERTPDEGQKPSKQQIIMVHVSARYDADQIFEELAANIPRKHWWRCHVAISAHLRYTHRWKHLVKQTGCIVLSQYMKWSSMGQQQRSHWNPKRTAHS
jgi:ribonuclease BN (tRNA processing enzyme)